MNILISICARGGSKGIPNKNIKELAGKPLILHSIDIAEQFKLASSNFVDIALSTDSEEIKDVVRKTDNSVFCNYSRPDVLASDMAGKLEVIKDLKYFMENHFNKTYDYIIDLDVTSPLRTLKDLNNAFSLLLNSPDAVNIFSVSPANKNPYFNMVEENNKGFYELSKKGNYLSRQSAPGVYELNASFYIYNATFFTNNYQSAITDKSIIFVVPHICFDLDHPIDFEFMSYLFENNKLDFFYQ